VEELKKLEEKYGWEVHVVAMDKLSRDEQIRLAARSTVSRILAEIEDTQLTPRSCAVSTGTVSPICSG
jgi:hypothetical protein